MSWQPPAGGEHPTDPGDHAQELVDLWSAPDANTLHRVLVLHPPAGRSADTFEPFGLLRRHHETEPATSFTTALLLLTDRRWRDGAARLVRRIADSAILTAEEVELLARTFLAAEKALFWRVPDEWLGPPIVIEGGFGAIDGDTDDLDGDGGAGDHHPDDDEPILTRREVFPPLRRWAAAHVLAQDPGAWPELLGRASELDPSSGAAVAAGLLDRADALAPAAQAVLVERTVRWPHATVRRLALRLIAAGDGPETARAVARDDPNAQIRRWAATLEAAPAPGQARGTSAQPRLF